MLRQLFCQAEIGKVRIVLFFLTLTISLVMSYWGFLAYSLLPADIIFSWGTVITKLLLIIGIVFLSIIKVNLSSKNIDIFYGVIFVILGICYYAIILRINTKQFKRNRIRLPLKSLLIHVTGVGINVIIMVPMGVDSFSVSLAVFGGIMVLGYICFDFFLVKKEKKGADGCFAKNLGDWLK